MNNVGNWITLKTVEENYSGIKAGTLRNYIARNQVIPSDKVVKVGDLWLIDKNWIDENYSLRDETEQSKKWN